MHELGIVIEILDVLDEIADENKLKKIIGVNIEAGELCGIMPEYFSECWKAARLGSRFEKTELRLNVNPAVAQCACGEKFELNACSRICPRCKKSDYKIISGSEFEITQIEAV